MGLVEIVVFRGRHGWGVGIYFPQQAAGSSIYNRYKSLSGRRVATHVGPARVSGVWQG